MRVDSLLTVTPLRHYSPAPTSRELTEKHKLTPFQVFKNVLLSSQRRIIAFIIKADEYIQQRLHTEALPIGLSGPVQDELLQLPQTHFPGHVCFGVRRFSLQ